LPRSLANWALSRGLKGSYHPSQNSTSNAVQDKRSDVPISQRNDKFALKVNSSYLILLLKFAPPVSSCVKVPEPGQRLDGQVGLLFLGIKKTVAAWPDKVVGIGASPSTHPWQYRKCVRHAKKTSLWVLDSQNWSFSALEAKNFEPTPH